MKNIIKKLQKPLIASAITATAFTAAIADEKQLTEQFPAFINDTFQQLDLQHGLGIAVIKGDEIVYKGAFGYADAKAGIKISNNTSFYIASSTKPFTGLAALLLANKGKLDLNKSLADFFPEVTFAPKLKADQITIWHLLAHTHGLENNALGFAVAFSGNHSPEKNLEYLRHTTANEEAPFGSFDYTNLGYNIFSMILERELGQPWQDILASEIFIPLGMTHTSSYISDANKNGWQIALPYLYGSADPIEPLYLMKQDNTMHAAGGMIASAQDLARFVMAQLNEGQIDGKQIFPKDTITNAHKSHAKFDIQRGPYHRTGYSAGWNLGTFQGESLTHHFGGFAGNSAHISFMPEHDFGVVILMNEGFISQRLAATFAGYAYDMLLDKDGVDTARRKQVKSFVPKAAVAVKGMAAQRKKLADRPWLLSHNFSAYTGTYSNPLYGSISVTELSPEKLEFRLGNMHAIATAYSQQDTMRLELVPGQGNVIAFKVNGVSVESFTYEGEVFVRE